MLIYFSLLHKELSFYVFCQVDLVKSGLLPNIILATLFSELHVHMQAEQRKGRTGRTCDGTVVRLVPRSTYFCFPKSEMPQMQLFSLRKQVLMITSAESKAINDPICKFLNSMIKNLLLAIASYITGGNHFDIMSATSCYLMELVDIIQQ